jgi:hypothetical protein
MDAHQQAQYDAGLIQRKAVMGEDFVARALDGVTEFTQPIRSSSLAMRGAMYGSAQDST